MSYTQTFHKTIAVSYSRTVNYPASQNGGSTTVTGTVYEDVTVNIEVNTTPFDSSINSCNGHIGALTGSVVATEAAQVASIRDNSRKVAQTIVSGFFKTVQSEISQQIAELQSRIDADLIHLHELDKRCKGLQQQMEVDYNRICSRYSKVFTDMNNELQNRIRALDRPIFDFKDSSDSCSIYAAGTSMAGMMAITGTEGGKLQAMLSASVSKKRSNDTLQKINQFLLQQKQLETILHQCILSESADATVYAPICYMKTENAGKTLGAHVHQLQDMAQMNEKQLITSLEAQKWQDMPANEAENIRQFFGVEMSKLSQESNTQHSQRVQDYISKLFNINSIKTL